MELSTANNLLHTIPDQIERAISTATKINTKNRKHMLRFPDMRRALDGTTLTDKQERAAWYFEMLGVIGYVILLKEVAEAEKTADSRDPWPEPRKRQSKKRPLPDPEDDYEDDTTPKEDEKLEDEAQSDIIGHEIWHRFITDLDLGSHSRTLYYLSSLPPELIHAWIHGNVPERLEDRVFSKRARPSVKLRDIQGTYAAMVAVAEQCSSTQPGSSQLDPGQGIKWSHLNDALRTMDHYTRAGCATKEQEKMAREIDFIFLHTSLNIDYTSQRKYGRGPRKNDFSKIDWWIDRMQDEILSLTGPGYYNKDDHMKRCLAYVGLASRVRNRALSHTSQRREESKLFGLFMSVLRYKFGDYYDTETYTYQIFRTTRIADIGLDEIISTELVSGHPWDGGLNFTWAGVSTGNHAARTHPDYIRQLKESAEFIRNSGFQEENIEISISKLERIQKWLPIAMSYQREASENGRVLRQNLRTLQRLKQRATDGLEQIKNLQRLNALRQLEEISAEYLAA